MGKLLKSILFPDITATKAFQYNYNIHYSKSIINF